MADGLTITFEIPGVPLGKQAMMPVHYNKGNYRYASMRIPPQTRSEMKRISDLFKCQYPHYPVSKNAFEYKMDILLPIPKSFTKKQRDQIAKGKLRPTSKPDISNVMKLVEDALSKLVWQDDSQIVETNCGKWYDDNPGIIMEITVIV